MRGMLRRWVLALAGTAGALFACNQILGIDDVTPVKPSLTQGDGGGGPITGDDDDGGTVIVGDSAVQVDPHPTMGLGFNHTCARMLDGTVRCWGADFNGELGDGVSLDASAPTPQDILLPKPVPAISDAIAIASGTSHTCIVHKTGKVSCWGDNFAGGLGNGTTDPSSTPVDVQGITDAINVGAGGGVTCIVHADHTASCWGANSAGGLGDGTTADSSQPVKVNDLTNVVEIKPSTNATCAVTSQGQVYCWGAGGDGQLGNGSLADTPKPSLLTALSNIVQIAVASRFACARQTTGSVFCWGRNDTGQLGNGSPTDAPNPSPIVVPLLTDAAWIWAGYGHACAVRANGQVMCWGDGTDGQLGIGPVDAEGTSSPTPTAVLSVTGAKSIFAGGDHTCVVTALNTAFCWGDNLDGQLGIGSTDPQPSPQQVTDFP